jgi:hypothetical protein
MLSRPRFLALGLSLSILWILIAYKQLAHLQFELGSNEGPKDGSRYVANMSKEDFIDTAINSAIEDDFDGNHIRAMCNDQEWDSTVVFTCRGVIGGIGMESPCPWNHLKTHIEQGT